MPNLCVIILNYFSPNNTEACVSSLVDQEFDTLYLIDNSADAHQAQCINSLANKLRDQDIKFKIIVLISKENLGFGAGINSAIKHDYQQSGGHELYLLLNNDTVLPSNTIKVLLEEKQKDPEIALLSPKIEWGGRDISYYGYIEFLGHVSSYPKKFAQPYVSGCCLLVDSELIDSDHTLFDDAFFMYGEDIYLNWKAKQQGKQIYCTDKVTIFHEGSGSSSHGGLFYEYHVARGHVLLGLKVNRPLYKKIAYILGRVFYLFMRGCLRSVRYRSVIPLQAYFMAWLPIKVRI